MTTPDPTLDDALPAAVSATPSVSSTPAPRAEAAVPPKPLDEALQSATDPSAPAATPAPAGGAVDATPRTPTAVAVEPAPSPMKRWRQRAVRAVPFVSLGSGVFGAFWMDRKPDTAWTVIAAAVGGWVLLMASVVVLRLETASTEALGRRAKLLRKSAKLAVIFGNQVAVQQALLFPLPFYLRAVSFEPGHIIFLLVYAGSLVVTLWDPLFERVMARPILAVLVQSWAVFVGLVMVLPVFGFGNGTSMWLSAAGTVVGAFVLYWALTPDRTRRGMLLVAIGAALLLTVVRQSASFVPPAPLELVRAGIGTAVVDRELVEVQESVSGPSELYCHTAIKAPLGLKDKLVHVWKYNRKIIQEVPLNVSGGRAEGFRTWSRKSGPVPPGRYRCFVQTQSGQVLGRAKITVTP